MNWNGLGLSWAAAALCLGASTLYAQPCPGAGGLEVTIEPAVMTIAGATPDGEVLIWGSQRARYAGAVTLVRDTETVQLADSNGEVTYVEEQDFESSASWLIVDLASGRSLMARANGEPFWSFDEDSMPPGQLLVGETELGSFNASNVRVIALQDGAIGRMRATDQSPEDMEPLGRRLKASLSDLVGMPGRGGAQPRGNSAAGDQYFVIDPRQRIAWHGCVPGPPQASTQGRDLAGGAR